MALSTLRLAARPLLLRQTLVISTARTPAASASTAYDELKFFWEKKSTPSAHDEMNMFWRRNQRLKRPSSPWTIYKPQWTWCLSLAHRITGVTMGVVLYTLSISLAVAPVDFTTCVEFVQSFGLGPVVLWPLKTIVAWPLIYHYSNGIRHLMWDAGKGFELPIIYRYGKATFVATWLTAGTLAALAYL